MKGLAALTALTLLGAASAHAQTSPTLTLAAGKYTLTVPYVEFGSGSSKLAYSANLTSSDLLSFTIDSASVRTVALQAGTGHPAVLSAAGAAYTLTLPYLDFGASSYAARLSTGNLQTFTTDLASVTPVVTTLAAPSSVAISNVDGRALAGSTVYSSSKLKLSWTAPTGYVVDHYLVSAREALKATSVNAIAAASDTSLTLSGLKSATSYSVVLTACRDSACTQLGRATAVSATTSEEYWQAQGSSGNTSDAVSRVTSDSNTLNYALVYGDWADSSLRGKVRYFYTPLTAAEKGTKAALTRSVASAATVSSVTTFDVDTGYGVVLGTGTTPSSGPTLFGQAQVVPYNGKMRLFVEAEGADRTNRIYSLDSVDGYVGLDYNPGAATKCTITSGELTSGGACAASIALGVTGDGFASKGVKALRQMRVLYPTQNSWVWDGSANTPMVVTIDLDNATSASCAQYKFTQGWALWNGSKWELQYAADGICPKLMDGVQTPAPVHLGDGRYKLYFSNNQTPYTQLATDFNNKPIKVIYGTASGSLISFEDFESVSQARDINIVWPDGSLMALFTSSSAGGETKFDDYTVLLPTGSSDFQVMYTNFSGGSKGAFTAAAVLLNP